MLVRQYAVVPLDAGLCRTPNDPTKLSQIDLRRVGLYECSYEGVSKGEFTRKLLIAMGADHQHAQWAG